MLKPVPEANANNYAFKPTAGDTVLPASGGYAALVLMIQTLAGMLVSGAMGVVAGVAYSLVTSICVAGFFYQWAGATRSERRVIFLAQLFSPTYYLAAFAPVAVYFTVVGDPAYSFWLGFWAASAGLLLLSAASLGSAP